MIFLQVIKQLGKEYKVIPLYTSAPEEGIIRLSRGCRAMPLPALEGVPKHAAAGFTANGKNARVCRK